MNQTVFERLGGTYREANGYQIPNLTLPDEEVRSIGIWGQRHLRYIRRHRRILYANLLTSGKLSNYLAEIDRHAEDRFFRLVNEYANVQGVTEQLKAENPFEWVQRMNSIQNAVAEVINAELIF